MDGRWIVIFMDQYGVLTGDVVSSTGMRNWNSIISQINSLLETLNNEFGDSIHMAFHVTVGDEFQGAFKDPLSLFSAYRALRLRMPVAFRCGMGVGGIEPSVKKDTSMRGMAFYRAREAIVLAKNFDRRSFIITSTDRTTKDVALNALLGFIDDIESHLTKRQGAMAKYYLLNGRPLHQDVATHFRVTPQSVSQTLKASKVSLIEEGEEAILSLLGGDDLKTPSKVKMLKSRK
jgi:hypothetical protein